MEVIDVNECESEVAPASLYLIIQVPRRKTVTSRNDVLGLHYAGPVILAVEKPAIAFLGARRCALERYVSALGANNYL
jgi:hypothetical protein